MKTHVIGDVHGCIDTLHNFIQFNMNIQSGDRLIFLGDYVDRGPKSAEVIEFIYSLVHDETDIDVIPLMGNHERLFLDFIDNPTDRNSRSLFLMNGGDRTLESYFDRESMYIENGCDMHTLQINTGYSSVGYCEIPTTQNVLIPVAHIDFIRNLKIKFEDEHFHYVHAGFRPLVHVGDQCEDDMLWIREEFLYSINLFAGKRVIHGHTPVPNVTSYENRINVDRGLGKNGNIGGLTINEDGTFITLERDHETNDVYGTCSLFSQRSLGGWAQ